MWLRHHQTFLLLLINTHHHRLCDEFMDELQTSVLVPCFVGSAAHFLWSPSPPPWFMFVTHGCWGLVQRDRRDLNPVGFILRWSNLRRSSRVGSRLVFCLLLYYLILRGRSQSVGEWAFSRFQLLLWVICDACVILSETSLKLLKLLCSLRLYICNTFICFRAFCFMLFLFIPGLNAISFIR